MQTTHTLKIMNYNILYGFHKITEPPVFEEQRLKLAQQIVKKENPDVLILTEACFGGKNPKKTMLAYSKLFNYEFEYYGPWGYEWGNCLLSKYPINADLVRLGNRTAIRAEVQVDGKILHIDVIHPDPALTEEQKVVAVKPLVSTLKKPYILAGDFNTLSDEDTYNPNMLIKGLRYLLKDKTEAAVAELMQRKLVPFVKGHGLTDAMQKNERTFTIPTDYLSKEKDSAMRIDYFFISNDINVIDSYVVRNPQTERASDHYPICITVFF